MKRTEIIDYIKAYATKFTFGSTLTYETPPVTSDLTDADIPSWGNVLEAGGNTNFIKDFTTSTGLTINWQTDLVDGVNTYAQILGNNLVRFPSVYAEVANMDGTFTDSKIDFNFDINLNADKSLITTVVFDWATSQSGSIVF